MCVDFADRFPPLPRRVFVSFNGALHRSHAPDTRPWDLSTPILGRGHIIRASTREAPPDARWRSTLLSARLPGRMLDRGPTVHRGRLSGTASGNFPMWAWASGGAWYSVGGGVRTRKEITAHVPRLVQPGSPNSARRNSSVAVLRLCAH